jgi:NADH-quinone oxidoreductase subunit L
MSPDTLITLALLAYAIPLLGFVLLVFFGKRLPRQGDWLEVSLITVVLGLALTILAQKLLYYHDLTIVLSFTWADFKNVPGIGPLKIDLGFQLDNLSTIMLTVVAVISTAVHYFSVGYMKGDVRYGRYFAFLGFFTFSMMTIVLADNLFLLYIGWELVGISSYLLIGHWYEKKSASDAAIKAFVVNRIGDFGFFVGIAILFNTFNTFGLREIVGAIQAGQLPHGSEGWMTAAGVLLFCGAIGKSAQFPLHVWLPDAMEGPTPVSALIHAATMVAAGVYLVARVFPILTADALIVIAYTGAVTAFISATIAVAQNDIKKVLAYSTISQLGYMVMGLGVGAYMAGFFHLVTHAMFKAGLFLASGSVIHAMHHALHHEHDHATDPQDIRNMGGLKARMPVTFWTFIVYTLAISGVPLTSGFLSKDAILAGTLAFGGLSGHILIPIIGFLVAGLTAFYMFRLVILTFLGEHAKPGRLAHVPESPKVMTVPLVLLAVLSIWCFYSLNPLSADGGWFAQAMQRPASAVPAPIAPVPGAEFAEAMHHAHTPAMLLSLLVAGLGILFAFATYRWKKIDADRVAQSMKPAHAFLSNKWYFDELYGAVVVGGTHALTRALRWFDNTIIDGAVNGAGWLTKITSAVSGKFDNGVIDGAVNATAYLSGFFGLLFRKFQTGRVQTYLAYVVAGVMVLYFVFRLF